MVDYVFEQHLSGGILLPANKTASTSTPIQRESLPTKLVLAPRQHRGHAAEPIVSVGQRILKGQLVATAAAASPSAAVHASTSGWVRAFEERPVLAGDGVQPSLCIVIEVDGRDEGLSAADLPAWPAEPAAQLAALRAGGIVGLGGAVYPTADKLATPVPCKTLFVNGAECEPYISCDDMLRRENAAEIVAGALLLTDVLAAPRCIIAATADEVRTDSYEWPCIRCGDCAMVCPSRLLPQDLLVAATTGDFAGLTTLGLQDCIECGCCDVICPAHIMVTERFRVAKPALAAHERHVPTER
jgi:Na+-translocating ferredoxin:NAD+ oxidoreductase RnfC subunit